MLETPLIKVNIITGITIIFNSLINIFPTGSDMAISFAVVASDAADETIIPSIAPSIKLANIKSSNLLLAFLAYS